MIDEEVLHFCSRISSEEPVYVPVRPWRKSIQSYCFENVTKWIKTHGGSIAYGWAIWLWPGVYFEAEHHGVWRNKKGGLVDVTPQLGGTKRILFLPDAAAVYDPFAFRSNVIEAVAGNSMATELVGVLNEFATLLNRYRTLGATAVRFSWQDNAQHVVLQGRFAKLSRQLSAKYPLR